MYYKYIHIRGSRISVAEFRKIVTGCTTPEQATVALEKAGCLIEQDTLPYLSLHLTEARIARGDNIE